MKLISMVDFVLADKYAGSPINTNKQYANFLKQPLELWMFVPCDEDGNVLEKSCEVFDDKCRYCACREYQKAKERVLFDGWNVNFETGIKTCISNESEYMLFLPSIMTIENILYTKPTLTHTALKQIGL